MLIVTRDQWGSKSKFKYGNMKLPALNVFLHHTVTSPTAYPYKDARTVEAIGISRFGQISYSFLVHPDGTVLEGAGTKTGAHTEDRNSTSFGIAMIGDYTKLTPTQAQISSFRELVHYLKVTQNWLVDSAVVTPHRAVSQTACPGNNIMLVLDQFREPWVPPAPPVMTIGNPVEVDVQLTPLFLSIPLDANGKGWTKIPYVIDKVVGVKPHSGTRPGADGSYDGTPDEVGFTPEGDGTIVVVQGGNPGGTAPVWLHVIS